MLLSVEYRATCKRGATVSNSADPDSYLLLAEDAPMGFMSLPEGERSDRLEGTAIKFRTFARDEAILSCGAYVAESDEAAGAIFAQTRENYTSVGGIWQDLAGIGDEALQTEVFPNDGSIQRVGVFRAGAVTAMIQYTGPRELIQPDEITRLLARMDEHGRAVTPGG